jgi:hypothetical protein
MNYHHIPFFHEKVVPISAFQMFIVSIAFDEQVGILGYAEVKPILSIFD